MGGEGRLVVVERAGLGLGVGWSGRKEVYGFRDF